MLAPQRLGYGIKGGAKAAVHTARQYLSQLQSDHALVKLDFLNSLHRVLEAVEALAPDIYPFVHSVYSSPSSLIWGEKTINSSEGVHRVPPGATPLLYVHLLPLHPFVGRFLHDVSGRYHPGWLYRGDHAGSGSHRVLCRDWDILNNHKSDIISSDPVTSEAQQRDVAWGSVG